MGKVQTVKKWHFYHVSRLEELEGWLGEMAKKGYRLAEARGFRFTFEECMPSEREYFCYVSPLFEKNDPFRKEYCRCKVQYGLRKSPLNKNGKSTEFFFEADPKKIDCLYLAAKRARRAHYRKCYGKALCVEAVLFLAFLLPGIINHWRFYVAAGCLAVGVLHSVFTLISLGRKEKK
ncbi:MAG: DUF2812 domain-containing protein [Clostridia bacterium]|nr:DUF2812 domain-containing protein [Clostridia bacterium]